MAFVSRMSAAVFVGPELCHDREWQDITITYATDMFLATRALRTYPRFTRTLANWFLPESRKCREQVRRGRKLIQEVLDKRAVQKREALAQGCEPDRHEDTLAWLEERASGKPYDAIAMQLGFAMAGLHTTTQLLKQAVLDICGQPELVSPLRDEIETAVAESGWTTAGLYKMQVLDSVVKETLRLKPGSLGEQRIPTHIPLVRLLTLSFLRRSPARPPSTEEYRTPRRHQDPAGHQCICRQLTHVGPGSLWRRCRPLRRFPFSAAPPGGRRGDIHGVEQPRPVHFRHGQVDLPWSLLRP